MSAVAVLIRSAKGVGARGRPLLSGDALHLSVFVHDASTDSWSYAPLCGTRMSSVQITGPWAERWPRDRHRPLCKRCTRKLAQLVTTAKELHDAEEA